MPKSPFKIDWTNLEEVKAYYKEALDSNSIIYKNPNRKNYNIIHKNRTDIYNPGWIVPVE